MMSIWLATGYFSVYASCWKNHRASWAEVLRRCWRASDVRLPCAVWLQWSVLMGAEKISRRAADMTQTQDVCPSPSPLHCCLSTVSYGVIALIHYPEFFAKLTSPSGLALCPNAEFYHQICHVWVKKQIIKQRYQDDLSGCPCFMHSFTWAVLDRSDPSGSLHPIYGSSLFSLQTEPVSSTCTNSQVEIRECEILRW